MKSDPPSKYFTSISLYGSGLWVIGGLRVRIAVTGPYSMSQKAIEKVYLDHPKWISE